MINCIFDKPPISSTLESHDPAAMDRRTSHTLQRKNMIYKMQSVQAVLFKSGGLSLINQQANGDQVQQSIHILSIRSAFTLFVRTIIVRTLTDTNIASHLEVETTAKNVRCVSSGHQDDRVDGSTPSLCAGIRTTTNSPFRYMFFPFQIV